MESICILGANSFLGQHLYPQIVGSCSRLNLWTFGEKFQHRLEVNRNSEPDHVSFYYGVETLGQAIAGCDVVYNLHEFIDFSNKPDERNLYEHNVKFVKDVINVSKANGVKLIVHQSSSFVQCSGRWPNVGNREKCAKNMPDNPYPSYSRTKTSAEELLQSCIGIKTLAARIGYVYGEGDEQGIICDYIRMREKLGCNVVIGDKLGAVQMTYIGNVAAALIECTRKMLAEDVTHEQVNITDDTPINSLYDGLLEQIFPEDRTNYNIPFWLFYPLFTLIAFVLRFLNTKYDIPGTGHVYMLFRQWTLLSNYRLRLFFECKPTYSYTTSLQRSTEYYRTLNVANLKSCSWKEKTFDVELGKELFARLSNCNINEVHNEFALDGFDIVSAGCHYLMTVDLNSIEDTVLNFASIAKQFYVSLNDLIDFVIFVSSTTNCNDLTVHNLYLEHLWDPQRVLLFCTFTYLTIHRPQILKSLENSNLNSEFDKLYKPSLTSTLFDCLAGLEEVENIMNTVDMEHFKLQTEDEMILELSDLLNELNVNRNDFLGNTSSLIQEMEKVSVSDYELHNIPELDLVGDNEAVNMELFQKMAEYKLCDHISLDYEKKMNISRQEKLWVEMDGRFHEGYLHSWLHDEEENRITHVKLQLKARTKRFIREVDASKVARAAPIGAMCNAGTRVLAKYKQGDEQKWKWGTLGTFPIKEYRFHYLVFFDDGTVKFTRPKNLYLCVIQPKNPDTNMFSAFYAHKYVKTIRGTFLKSYFSLYPNWPLMSVQVDTTMLVNREVGKKKSAVKACVIQKDRCLLLVRFLTEFDEYSDCKDYPCTEHSHEDEWIFAGDTLKIPTLKNILSKLDTATDISTYPEKIRAYVEMLYPKYEVEEAREISVDTAVVKTKNTARKRGNRKGMEFFDFFNNAQHHQVTVTEPNEQGDQQAADNLIPEHLEYPNWDHLTKKSHFKCSAMCVDQIKKCHLIGKSQYKDIPLFFRPFLFGFKRSSVTYFDIDRYDDQDRTDAIESSFVYESPCGRLLRSLDEVAYYLHLTRCEYVSVDQFTFRSWDRPNFIYRSDPKYVVDRDFAHCKEAVSIPTVNAVNDEGSPMMLYQSSRCIDGPLLDTQMEFTSCCSCTDDCLDTEKCECQQLTKQTHQRLDEKIRADISDDGYKFKRLERKLFSGIYECNIMCSCSRNCLNRVVQREVCISMQLFKTAKKGWGVKTLVDIPQGQFVCTYSGQMFTDVKADEHVRKGQGSDMYFADVDLFDSVEGMKRNLNICNTDDEGVDMGEKKTRKKKRRKSKWTHHKKAKEPEVPEITEKSLLHHLFGDSRLFVVDAQERGNLGRFFNHSCDPNLEVQMVFTDTHDIRLPMIAFFTSCDVEAGTELCWNYGYVPGSVPGKVIECSCGSAICVGRIFCGGFVRSPAPSILQKVKVQFLSDEGHLKHETACNPTNGYYVIPVYSKGTYKIRVSSLDGYIFSPSEKVVNVNDDNNDCASGNDINFQLSGFQVSGRIVSGSTNSNQKLQLGLFTENGEQVAVTTTDSNGIYKFEAAPGSYVVSTVEAADQCIERGSASVKVVDKPVVIGTDLKISGQNLDVIVKSSSGEVIRGAEVTLLSATEIPFDRQVNVQKPSITKQDNKHAYTLRTQEHGDVTFSCLPSASYKLKVSWRSAETSLAFEPSERLIIIDSKPEDITFKSTGFVTKGHLNEKLADVKILVKKQGGNYEVAGKSDKDGQFSVSGLKEGIYVVTAQKDRFEFDEKHVTVGLKGEGIGEIFLHRLEVCGRIVFDNDKSLEGAYNVKIEDSKNSVDVVKVDSNGKWCAYLAKGRYTVVPGFSTPTVHPKSLILEVKSLPVDNLVFTEFKAKISGSLQCLDDCTGLTLDLGRRGSVISRHEVSGKDFVFEDITPGEYELSLNDKNDRCWEQAVYYVRVESKNVQDIVIRQTGYHAIVESQKAASLKWEGASGAHGVVDVHSGSSKFCIPQKGVYSITVDSCYGFEEGLKFSKELPKDVINLKVKHSRVGVIVTSDHSVDLSDTALVVRTPYGDETIKATKTEKNTASFQFNVKQENVRADVELVPSSKKLLFTPSRHSFTFDGNCNDDLVVFKAVQGKYVEGVVEPALKAIEVTIVNKNNGEKLNGKTDTSGNFKIGLVFDPAEYEVTLELEGYKFTSSGNNKFRSTKLSKLVVFYVDEKTKEPLGEVLVSVSGGVDYRNNVVVDETGRKSFVGLPAGDYFITSFLREYQFNQDQTSVSIKEGETVEKIILGKRYAYSAFGSVSAAGGLALENVKLEALSESCGNLLEEDITDREGKFRVRGLKPGCDYKLVAKSRKGQPVRAIPPFIKLKTKPEDIRGLEFVVMVAAPQNQILGFVQFEGLQRLKSLIVDLYEDGKKIASDNLGATNNLFVFTGLMAPGKEYQVKVSEKQLKNLNAVSSPVVFSAPQSSGIDEVKQVAIVVKTLFKKTEIETSKSNVIGVIFVILVTFVCMNLNNSKDLALEAYDRAVGAIRRSASPSPERRKKQKKN
ncbi:unnamed protein product [Bursaphelenchus okinawaensis]|uniref:Uncharacterized protein n=1 Tax=Bursaphelenchus okinawaensis TaxID=465554 RepID=A0A811KI47_9BILA|nr:unnamed protein product [Bursaphelenchus okinawaensis]CAG9103645.1 unnamed protein product [Bursaphelenchus okinawaensis]